MRTYGSFVLPFGFRDRRGDQVPVNGIGVTEVSISLDPHSPSFNGLQVLEVQFGQGVHLVDDERVVLEQLLPPNDCQVREEATDVLQARDPEDQQVVRDLDQVRERQVREVRGSRVVKEHDLQVALNDSAVTQLIEGRDGGADVHGGADELLLSRQHLGSDSGPQSAA